MRGEWDRRRAAGVAVGGTAGAGLRWAVIALTEAGTFPWPVLALNVAGSVLLGVLISLGLGGVIADQFAVHWVYAGGAVLLLGAAAVRFTAPMSDTPEDRRS